MKRAFFVLVVGLVGCTSQPMVVRKAPLPVEPSSIAAAPVVPAYCQLDVQKITDQRLDPVTLGRVDGRIVRAPDDVRGWLANELRGLRARGIQVQFAGAASTKPSLPAVQADVELVSVWLSSMATTKVATVVMNFSYRREGRLLTTAVYRGNLNVVNWASTDAEIQQALDDAFGQILDQAAIDLQRMCTLPKAPAK
jgi:hypothetical protein